MSDFNPAYRGFVSYIDKSREFYLNKGYNNPYRWATHSDAPFTALAKPLSESRIGVITTAAPDEEGGINRRVYSAVASHLVFMAYPPNTATVRRKQKMDRRSSKCAERMVLISRS